MRFLLQTLGIVVIATTVAFAWHVGTSMDPLEQNIAIQACALSARIELRKRDTENDFPIMVRWGLAERLFRDIKVSAHVSINGGPDTLIFCDKRDGQLRALIVDGEFLREYD